MLKAEAFIKNDRPEVSKPLTVVNFDRAEVPKAEAFIKIMRTEVPKAENHQIRQARNSKT